MHGAGDMRNGSRPRAAALAGLLLTGCVAQAAYDVVTLPVRAGAKVVDWSTTSQSEADRNRGRRERKAEEKQRKADRKAAKDAERARREAERDN